MKLSLLPFLFALFLLPLAGRAEKPSAALHLLALDAWTETGAWAKAGKIHGNTGEKKWKSIAPGDAVLYNGPAGKTTNIVSKEEHGDVELQVEFMIPKSSNSGIYLMGRYEIQILDSYGKPDDGLSPADCGGIYERWDESKPDGAKGYEGTAPATNASTAPGTWQTYQIQFRAPRFDSEGKKTENARFLRVVHNGVVIHEDVEVTGPTRGGIAGPELARGPLTVQGDHGPIAFRKFTLRHTTFQ